MIKIKIIEQPTTRPIYIKCPHCKIILLCVVKFNQQKGYEECALCHTKFEWEETEQVSPIPKWQKGDPLADIDG